MSRDSSIRPLDPSVADTLRIRLKGLDHNLAWKITRLCEQAQAIGYDQGYVRGYTDGWDAGDAAAKPQGDGHE